MGAFFSSAQDIVKVPELRRKLLVTFGLLVVYRLGSVITLPGIDVGRIEAFLERGGAAGGGLAGVLRFASIITGGALSQCTVFALGIMPYISASIIFQLLVKVLPSLEALSKEGEAGRRKITQYTRYATVGLCLIQSLFVVGFIKNSGNWGDQGVVFQEILRDHALGWSLMTVMTLTTGTIFLMWLGEQISEFGIGNGISIIIMVGIVANMPGALWNFFQEALAKASGGGGNLAVEALKLVIFCALFVMVVIGVVIMQLGQRRITIQHARHTRGRRVYGGQRHYLPLRVNSAGVMPIIFAQSLLILPSVLFSAIALGGIANIFSRGRGFWYISLYLFLIGFFTYFWSSITFNPVDMANNMKEYGSFIPGIRPGRRTAEYLEKIINRITLAGAGFLAFVAIFPDLVAGSLGLDRFLTSFLGGTGILIVVGVALDVIQKIESHLLMRHYGGFEGFFKSKKF